MIKLRDSEIIDILPVFLSESPEVKALSYAISRQVRGIIDSMGLSMVYAGIDELPGNILDVLALEFRAPYYDTDLDISVKRDIIKSTFKWHSIAGTPRAVKELVEATTGECEVIEWFSYDGDPYHFKMTVNVTDDDITPEKQALVQKIISAYKNARSILDSVEYFNVGSEIDYFCHAGIYGEAITDSASARAY